MQAELTGVPASPGIVVGPAHLLRWEVPDVDARVLLDEEIDGEIARFRAAAAKAIERLRGVKARAAEKAGEAESAIFDVQISILEDASLREQVEGLVQQNLAPEKAFDIVMLDWRDHFGRSTNPMMRERIGDLVDVHIRLLTVLLDLPDHDPVDLAPGSNAIVVTHDLTPSLTIQLDRRAIAGIATDAGTRTSHVAILARSLGLPAVVGLINATSRITSGERVILDGTNGRLIVKPTAAELAQFADRARREAEAQKELAGLVGKEALTSDGVHITLRANVDLPEEAGAAASHGAEGVGLMRTEFLVVGRTAMPTEDEQYRAYRKVVEAFKDQPVVIRTYDVGGDKLPVGGFPHEPNPFLGWRAIRMCLDEPELFKVQLKALMRAAVHGDLQIMLPLVVSVEEVRQARYLLEDAAAELRAKGVEHRADVPLGVMVETPAAAVSVDSFVKDVSFLSIGTNDLVQYTLAVDRGNASLVTRFTPLHPAVLRLIARTVEVGHAAGLSVSVCGEMASQPLMAYALIGLGVRQLSVAAVGISAVKRIVRGVSTERAAAAAQAALAAATAREAADILRHALRAELGDELLDGLLGLG
ncbi:phosphoenolpyruvate--protein phosphotransferase [Pseudogemmatithrix spongiicola]|uniref:Phosphoenolpyruvate-protein phosphotransferase n=1 Tax=Pseudogemmatithrix spongiicola TaxID=3062599 RepID=A0AA49Q4Q0_9BACT|nr:phosphoenolpyruvate--protein phosphotransferase [Gemmatimonadaceae bacterium 'strain 138']WKW14965.1 phosphoenolpyruvate--protein phosphotransferase [Gemmatimonadaceae bacterium 'strain 318']